LPHFIDIFQIWNHPDILYKIMRQKKTDLADEKDLDIETETSGGKKRGVKASAAAIQPDLSANPRCNLNVLVKFK
jgi:hypothetical protein